MMLLRYAKRRNEVGCRGQTQRVRTCLVPGGSGVVDRRARGCEAGI